MKKPCLPIPAFRERGQSLVELAISLMVILMLLTGAVEFGLALFQYVTIRDAAQEGALYGSINPDDVAGMKQRAEAAASDVLDLDTGDVNDPIDPNSDITIEWSELHCEGIGATTGTPNSVTVAITFEHPITMPLVSTMIGTDTINLTASVTDTILTPVCP